MTKKWNNVYKSRLKTVSLALVLVIVLSCASFSWLAIPTSAEGQTGAPRDYGSGRMIYLYPEVGDDGTVSPKAYMTVNSNPETTGVLALGDTNSSFAKQTYGATEDGFLTVKPDKVNTGFAIRTTMTGYMSNANAKYVSVCYRVVGETSYNGELTFGHWGGATKLTSTSFSNEGNGWNVVTTENKDTDNNWWGPNTNFTVIFPGLKNADSYIVVDYVAFCATEEEVEAIKAARESFLNPEPEPEPDPFCVSRENRTYGNAAVGLYFNPEVGEDGTVTAKIKRTVCNGVNNLSESTLNYSKFASELKFGVSEEGFLKINTTQTVNQYTMTLSDWTGTLLSTQVKYVIVRYKVVGEAPSSEVWLMGSDWAAQENNGRRLDVALPGEADVWNTVSAEVSVPQGDWLGGSIGNAPKIQLPNLQSTNSYYILDYIGFCADEAARDATLAAIEQANNYDLYGGVQLSKTENRMIRFVGKLDALNEKYDKVGFVLTANGMSYTMTADKAYTSILADGEPLTAESEGCRYFYTYAVDNIPTDQGIIRFTVTPYVSLKGQTDVIMGATVSFGYNPTTNELVKLR